MPLVLLHFSSYIRQPLNLLSSHRLVFFFISASRFSLPFSFCLYTFYVSLFWFFLYLIFSPLFPAIWVFFSWTFHFFFRSNLSIEWNGFVRKVKEFWCFFGNQVQLYTRFEKFKFVNFFRHVWFFQSFHNFFQEEKMEKVIF